MRRAFPTDFIALRDRFRPDVRDGGVFARVTGQTPPLARLISSQILFVKFFLPAIQTHRLPIDEHHIDVSHHL
jgi:hypothetical protein